MSLLIYLDFNKLLSLIAVSIFSFLLKVLDCHNGKAKPFTGDDLPPKIVYTTRSHGWSTTKLKDLITKQTIEQNPNILK